jgi:tRNA/rRNA methyltransferase/tRNA (cytidine32/uridine32-2'-O)-methyltransferase
MPRETDTDPFRPSGRRDPSRPRRTHSGRPRAPTQDATALANIVVVLDEPQDVVNVSAVIRAMMNMGLARLRLVRPLEFDPYRIEGIAHRSSHIVGAAELHDTLASAVADAVFVAGTSARPRTANRNYVRPREAASTLIEQAGAGPVCILFGREDRGLTNEALDLCHAIITIPTDPEYWSLNLAQAFLVVAYEVFLAAGGAAGELPKGRRDAEPATHAELERMYAALEAGLTRIAFFKGARQPEAVLRTLRTALGRSGLDTREARLIQAIGFEIGHYLDRTSEEG